MTKKTKITRIKEFQKVLARNGLDGYVSNDTLDQGFLTGYFRNFSDEGVLLITPENAVMFMKAMLVNQFKKTAPSVKAVGCQNHEILPFFVEEIKRRKLKKVAFDPDKEFYQVGKVWHKNKFKEMGGFIKSLREIKNEQELKYIRKSCQIAARAFEIIKPKIKPGRTEKSIALELENIMKNMGASGLSFPTIVASGPNSAFVHHKTSDKKVKNNEAILMDFGCVYENYCSDITRTFWLGKKPSPLYKKIKAIVVKAHDQSMGAVKPGVKAVFVDKVARDIIDKAGYGDKFPHCLGHGIGLEVHEMPMASKVSKDIIRCGMTFTIEPGIYLNGKLGVRHENSIVVTKTGYKILTKK